MRRFFKLDYLANGMGLLSSPPARIKLDTDLQEAFEQVTDGVKAGKVSMMSVIAPADYSMIYTHFLLEQVRRNAPNRPPPPLRPSFRGQ